MHIRTLLLIPLVAGCVALLPAGSAQAQQPQAKVTENKAERGRGAESNIRPDRTPNREGAGVAAPAAKGGDRTRGGVSIVHIDNWTQWYIAVDLNGQACGSVSPWGDLYCYVSSGNVTLYAEAPGVNLKWGPRVDYVDGAYTWKLNP